MTEDKPKYLRDQYRCNSCRHLADVEDIITLETEDGDVNVCYHCFNYIVGGNTW